MGVEMIRDLSHRPIEGPDAGSQALVGHAAELGQHVVDDVVGWILPVLLPDHHGHEAHLTVGHPARLVFVEPLGDASGFAQLALSRAVTSSFGPRP